MINGIRGKKVLLAEPDDEHRRTALLLLRKLGAEVLPAVDGAQALRAIETGGLDLVICASRIPTHSARELCNYAQEFVNVQLPVVLLVDTDAESETERAASGADAVMIRPLSAAQVGNLAGLLFSRAESSERLRQLEQENSHLRESLDEMQRPDPEVRLYRFDLFKQVIVMEVKKARRYGFPLALLLLAIDNYGEMAGWLSAEQRKNLFALLHKTLVHDIRDIDIPVLFAEQKILVVMPHTALDGAVVVADRIREHVKKIKPPSSLTQLALSVSVAVASTAGGEETSFGKIVQQAMRGLEEAAIKGGDLVVVCRPAVQSGQAQDEIPGGKMGPRTFFV
jgi:diguanylate cyclase (GGDEF)-like protein